MMAGDCLRRFDRRKTGRVVLWTALSALLFVGPLTASAQTANHQAGKSDDVTVIEKAFAAEDIDALEAELPKMLDNGLLARSPKVAAKAALALVQAQAQAGQWKQIDVILNDRLDDLRSALGGKEGDEFLLIAAHSAGYQNKPDLQDALLARFIDSTTQRAGEASKEALTARVDAAYSRMTAGRNKEAEAAMMSALRAMELHGQADLFFNTAGQAGGHFADKGYTDAAETMFDYGLNSRLNATDQGPGRGFLLFNAAAYLRDQHRFKDAQILGTEALQRLTAAFGSDSEYSIQAYDGLAQSLHGAGSLAPAAAAYAYLEPNATRALGKDNPAVWRIMNNRAAVLRALKLPASALEHDRAAYNARYQALGGGAGDTLISAVNMSHDLIEMRRFAEASEVLTNIARIVSRPGYNDGFKRQVLRWRDYADLRSGTSPINLEALKAGDRTFVDPADLDVSLAYFELYGEAAEKAGLNDLALDLRQQASRMAQNGIGQNHPLYFDTVLSYADLLGRVRPDEAAVVYADLNARLFEWTRANVSSGGSLEAGKAAKILGDDTIRSLTAYASRSADGAELLAYAADRWKSMRSETDRRLRALADDDRNVKLRDAASDYLRLSGWLREIVSVSLFTADLQPLSDRMVAARRSLNQDLAASGSDLVVEPWFEAHPQPFVPLEKPGPGDVIVDFVSYGLWSPDRSGLPSTQRFYAVISRHDGPPKVISAFDLPTGQPQAVQDASVRIARKLLTSVMMDAAKDAKAIYINPTNELFQFPFAEMVMPGGKRLGELIDIHIISSRDAYARRGHDDRPDAAKGLLLAGGLKYGKKAGAAYLPGSAKEIASIQRVAAAKGYKVEQLRGTTATERKLKGMVAGKGIVHFATHGFYLQSDTLDEKLLNAGFVASGATGGNTKESDKDNVVYARELLSWDLSAAGLVTISACETALSGQGVTSVGRGLPLALASAGAQRVLLTVDIVNDEATAAFMARFYRFIFEEGQTYGQAFMAAKREAWAGNIKGVVPEMTAAYVLYEN